MRIVGCVQIFGFLLSHNSRLDFQHNLLLALVANHHQLCPDALVCKKFAVLQWRWQIPGRVKLSQIILLRVIAVMGHPAAYLKDGGSDLRRVHRPVNEQGQASLAINDISHAVTTTLRQQYQNQPTMATFFSLDVQVFFKLDRFYT